MKNTKRFLSLILTLVMLFTLSSTAFAGFDDISKGIWDAAWAKSEKTIKAAVTMFPGSDENDRIIAWYSDTAEGYVELKGLKGSEKITASVKKTPEGDNRLWAELNDLEPGIYTYRCVSGEYKSMFYTFTVEKPDSFTAVYVSDIHITDDSEENKTELRDTAYQWDTTLEEAVLKAAGNGNTIDVILSGGDQASEGLRNEFEGLSTSNIVNPFPLQ